MIPVAAGVRIWIASGHTDMRKGMNGLALLVQEGLGRDPFAGPTMITASVDTCIQPQRPIPREHRSILAASQRECGNIF
jgi:transposase